MKKRLALWLEKTHGTGFELTRHFLSRLFDSEIVATPGEWSKVIGGVFAIALSAFILMAPMYVGKYTGALKSFRPILANPESYVRAVRADELSFVALAMAITAVLTALLWQSLFPGRRDYLALASLPIRPRQMFAARFRGIVLVFGIFIVLLTALPAICFGGITQGRGIESPWHGAATFAAWSGGCAFVFFGLVAVQGILLNLLPARWFARVSIWAQGLVLAAAVWELSSLDLQPRSALWPPNWFVDLWAAMTGLPGGDSRFAVMALVFAPLLAIATYAFSARRYRRLVIEAHAESAAAGWGLGDWLLRRWIDDPREQAMFSFMWQSLMRSRAHRLILWACAGFCAALNARLLAGGTSAAQGWEAGVILGPLTMAVVAIIGLRYLFSLPAELESNWIFRINEREGRSHWLNAVERFVVWCGVAPMFLIWLPAAVWALGAGAAAAYLPGIALVLLVYEMLFRGWRKAPFTCSYLPGKRPIWQLLMLLPAGLIAVTVASYLLLLGVLFPPVFFVEITVLTVAWRRARARRLQEWRGRPLIYEDAAEIEIAGLHLQGDMALAARASWSEEDEPLWAAGPDAEHVRARIRRWLRDLPIDLFQGARVLAKNKGFAATAIVTLGLGLGLNAAFFTVYNAFCLKPVAVRDPYSLFEYSEMVAADRGSGRETRTSLPDLREFHDLQRKTDILTGAVARSHVVTRLGDVRSPGLMVSGNYFSMLGAGAKLGRLIGESDDLPVMVLSYRAWRYRFGGDAAILGRRIAVQKLAYTVIGVTRPEFGGVATDLQPDFWIPLSTWPALEQTILEPHSLNVVIRLKAGVTNQVADAALLAWVRESQPGRQAVAVALHSVATPIAATEVSGLAFGFLLVFAFTMAIPCANVANMMLARGLSRQREIGVRIALGAGRGRIVRQFLTEGLVMALLGALAGIAVAWVGVEAAQRALYSTLPSLPYLDDLQGRLPDLGIDYRVLIYLAGVAMLTAFAFAFTPAVQATRWGAAGGLRRESFGVPERWLRDALVVGQVALCLMLLACSTLMLRGIGRATSVDLGFSARDVHGIGWSARSLPPTVEAALRGQSWIAAVATFSFSPLEMGSIQANGERQYRVRYNMVSPDYLEVLRIPLVRGRKFTPDEAASRAPLAIVSEGTAKRLWPSGGDVVGKTFRFDVDGGLARPLRPGFHQARVIGVTREADLSAAYFPASNQGMGLIVRGRGDTKDTSRRLEQLLAKVASPEAAQVSLEEYVYFQSYGARAGSMLASVLGVIALLLTASGMYGVMSFLAGQRKREMGIRIALGATKRTVTGLMVRDSARLVLFGSSIGLVLALWGAKLIAAMTEYISAYDLPAYAIGLAVVGSAAIAAALVPALRVSQVNPAEILRSE